MKKKEEYSEVCKAMADLGWDDLADELVKSETAEEEKVADEELTDEEKAKIVKDKEDLEKADKAKEDEEEKPEEIKKAIEDALGVQMNPLKTIIKGFMDNSQSLAKENVELKKSLSDMLGEVAEMKKSIDDIAEMPIQRNAVGNVKVIEKGGHMEDEDDNLILSVSNPDHKSLIVKAMGEGLDNTTDEILKGAYNEDLLGCFGSKVKISPEVVKDLMANKQIRIVK